VTLLSDFGDVTRPGALFGNSTENRKLLGNSEEPFFGLAIRPANGMLR